MAVGASYRVKGEFKGMTCLLLCLFSIFSFLLGYCSGVSITTEKYRAFAETLIQLGESAVSRLEKLRQIELDRFTKPNIK